MGIRAQYVVQNHNVSDSEVGVQATGGIGHNYSLDSQLLHDTGGEGDLLNRMSLIETVARKH